MAIQQAIRHGEGGDLLTADEVASLMKVHRNTVHRWCASGRLAHVRVGRNYRIPRSALARYAVEGGAGDAASEVAVAPSSPTPLACRTIAVALQKGGAGKSSTVANLGSALAEMGYRVIMVDCDQQANLTTTFTGRQDVAPGLAEVLIDRLPVAEALLQTAQPDLALLPGAATLANVEIHFAAKVGREFLLRPIVRQLADLADIVLLDTPPSLGPLTVSALMASAGLIVPISPQLYSSVGLTLFEETVRTVREEMGHDQLRVLGYLLNRMPATGRDGAPRTVAHRNVVTALRAAHGDSIFATTIPDATVVEEAHLAQVGVVHWRPDSAVAQAYRALAQEVIARAQ